MHDKDKILSIIAMSKDEDERSYVHAWIINKITEHEEP